MGGSEVTVGLSIPMPAPYDAVLQEWRRRSGDPMAELVMPHVTLVPPTPVAEEALDRVLSTLRERCTGLTSFPLRLRGTGTFRPISDVVFVAVADGISHCEVLAERLRTDELRPQLEYPYHPHVTVAQNVPTEALDAVFDGLEDFRADIVVDEVWAHRQNDDGSWTPLTSFALAEGNQEQT
ncbi:2'-5' RNA ligase family protein [Cumulibacter manganitolerans]|uniref:2'-5' RNA ligase family protein n=1 Tax=Cumulibacter manganitolerans TaxID=1884992 RepID=UPI001294E165|nr:2'-5' RNA ligase family protein [Cumulibacter manganitolerans]